MSDCVVESESEQERKSFIIIIKNFKDNMFFYVNNELMNNHKNAYLKIQIWIKQDSDEKVISQNNKKDEIAKSQKIILQWSCHSLQNWFFSEHESVYKNTDMNDYINVDIDVYLKDSYVKSNSEGNINNFIFNKLKKEINININTEYTEKCMKSDSISDAIDENENKSNFFADDFNVTNNKYDADSEEIKIIVWRHIIFHVIKSFVLE